MDFITVACACIYLLLLTHFIQYFMLQLFVGINILVSMIIKNKPTLIYVE